MLTILNDSHWYIRILSNPFKDLYNDKDLKELSAEDIYKLAENIPITIYAHGFPHSVAMQARTHRLMTFDVQSQRYTQDRSVKVSRKELDIWSVFYFRNLDKLPVEEKKIMEDSIISQCEQFSKLLSIGVPAEAARDILPQGIRQNFVVTASLRSWLHFFDLRYKSDAQPEIQTLSYYLIHAFKQDLPNFLNYYLETRATKGILAP